MSQSPGRDVRNGFYAVCWSVRVTFCQAIPFDLLAHPFCLVDRLLTQRLLPSSEELHIESEVKAHRSLPVKINIFDFTGRP